MRVACVLLDVLGTTFTFGWSPLYSGLSGRMDDGEQEMHERNGMHKNTTRIIEELQSLISSVSARHMV